MSIFAEKEESVWRLALPQDIVTGYIQDNRKYITPTHECLRVILTKRLPQQLVWLKHWMKCGGVLDQLWVSPTSSASDIQVLSIMEILSELSLTDETSDFFSRLRCVFECLWMRHSKETAKNVLSTMDPKMREALLLAKFEGPTGDLTPAPLVYHAVHYNRTHLAQFLLLSDHGRDDAIFKLVLDKRKKHWIAWFLRNELSTKSIAIDYLVSTDNITELRKITPKTSAAWLQNLHKSISTAVTNDCAETLEWLLESGADPNCESITRCSPELLHVFLKHGADPNLYGLDFFDRACWKLLLMHGARARLTEHIIEPWVIHINKVYDSVPFAMTDEIRERLLDLFSNLSNVLGPCDTTQLLYNNIEKLLGVQNTEEKEEENE